MNVFGADGRSRLCSLRSHMGTPPQRNFALGAPPITRDIA